MLGRQALALLYFPVQQSCGVEYLAQAEKQGLKSGRGREGESG